MVQKILTTLGIVLLAASCGGLDGPDGPVGSKGDWGGYTCERLGVTYLPGATIGDLLCEGGVFIIREDWRVVVVSAEIRERIPTWDSAVYAAAPPDPSVHCTVAYAETDDGIDYRSREIEGSTTTLDNNPRPRWNEPVLQAKRDQLRQGLECEVRDRDGGPFYEEVGRCSFERLRFDEPTITLTAEDCLGHLARLELRLERVR